MKETAYNPTLAFDLPGCKNIDKTQMASNAKIGKRLSRSAHFRDFVPFASYASSR